MGSAASVAHPDAFGFREGAGSGVACHPTGNPARSFPSPMPSAPPVSPGPSPSGSPDSSPRSRPERDAVHWVRLLRWPVAAVLIAGLLVLGVWRLIVGLERAGAAAANLPLAVADRLGEAARGLLTGNVTETFSGADPHRGSERRRAPRGGGRRKCREPDAQRRAVRLLGSRAARHDHGRGPGPGDLPLPPAARRGVGGRDRRAGSAACVRRPCAPRSRRQSTPSGWSAASTSRGSGSMPWNSLRHSNAS